MLPVNTAEEYWSCKWIEGGLAFNRRSLHVCLIVHHEGRGFPYIGEYNGGEIPIEAVLEVRRQIREANQTGGHPACKGCAHLRKQRWPVSRYPITILGIAHFSYCNLECNYCFLQTQDRSSFADGYRPYSIVPAVRALVDRGALAPNAIIDWGGGEPTYYREFDTVLEILLNHGTSHLLHTNGTRVPAVLRNNRLASRVHVICSIDAGTSETYVAIKKRDYLDRVWENLLDYDRLGAKVTLKYIVTRLNCAPTEVDAFLACAKKLPRAKLIVDVDYNQPNADAATVGAIARLMCGAQDQRTRVRFGFTGAFFGNDRQLMRRIDAAVQNERFARNASFAATHRTKASKWNSAIWRYFRRFKRV
jgi:organic radical activating enzyme